MKLTERRKQAIYSAVSDKVMDARVRLKMLADSLPAPRRGWVNWETIDTELSATMDRAGQAAIAAAEERHRKPKAKKQEVTR